MYSQSRGFSYYLLGRATQAGAVTQAAAQAAPLFIHTLYNVQNTEKYVKHLKNKLIFDGRTDGPTDIVPYRVA